MATRTTTGPSTARVPDGTSLDSPEYALVAKLTNVKPLVQLLKAIHFKKQTHCVLTHRGVKFSVEDSRSVQAHAYLQRQFFSEFRFGPHWHRGPLPNSSRGGGGHPNSAGREAEDTRGAGLGEGEEEEELEMVFALDLTVLLQCLTIFSGTAGNALAHSANTPANSLDGTGGVGGGIPGGPVGGFGNPTSAHARYKSNTSLGWVVNDKGSEVELVLEENEVISVCKLATFESEEITDFQFQVHPIQHRLIIKSDILRDALSELDNASEKITFTFSAHSPHFRISTVGMAGSTEVNFSKDTDIIESFYSAEPAQHAYRYNQVQHALNALVYSSKTSVRINQYGFLSMQFMIQADRGDACFVELLCAPMQSFEQLI